MSAHTLLSVGRSLGQARWPVGRSWSRGAATRWPFLCLALAVGMNAAVFDTLGGLPSGSSPCQGARRSRSGGGGGSRTPMISWTRRALRPRWTCRSRDNWLDVGIGQRRARARVQCVSPGYLSLLGVRPYSGRLLDRGAERRGQPAVLLGHGFWQRQFGGERSAIGLGLEIRGSIYTIVGVARGSPGWCLNQLTCRSPWTGTVNRAARSVSAYRAPRPHRGSG